MLQSVNDLTGFRMGATDGEIGKIEEVYFDDERWVIRYLIVDVGSWLFGRKVLISPHGVEAIGGTKTINTRLTRSQVEGSPDIDTEMPVSRQMEAAYYRYYGYPAYWAGGYAGLWGWGATPAAVVDPVARQDALRREEEGEAALRDATSDVHLRSSKEVTGYGIRATDDSIGHVEDLLFDDETWAISHLVVDTRNGWPGKQVLISPERISKVSWPDRSVVVDLAREDVKASPRFDPKRPSQSSLTYRL
jgi:uncharacterized protein YrrD